MKHTKIQPLRVACLVAVVVLLLPLAAAAEISVSANGQLYTNFRGGQVWAPVRSGLPPERILNPEGDLHGDILDDWGVNPVSGMPEVAWSRQRGDGYDVVFSWWDGQVWQGPVAVSHSSFGTSHLRARLYHDLDGSRYVMWTARGSDDSDALLAASLPGDPYFCHPRRMHPDDVEGLLPSGVMTDLSLLTIHEEVRPSGDRFLELLEWALIEPWARGVPVDNPVNRGETEIGDGAASSMQAPRPDSGEGPSRPSADTFEDEVPSDPRVYLEDDVLWVDWVDSSTRMGYSVWENGDLGPNHYVSIDGPGDLSRARKKIRQTVLHPDNSARGR